MKTTKRTLILLFTLFIFSIPVNSHPGRTDAKGGHWNHSTGEYHYHTGEYAGKKQSSSYSENSSFRIEHMQEPEAVISQDNDMSTRMRFAFLIDGLIPLSAAVGLICMLIGSVLSATKKSNRKEKLSTALGCSFYIFAMLIPLLLIFIQGILIK